MPEPVRIAVRVSPGARRSAVVGPYADGWKVAVAAPPEGGRANEAVVRLLAGVLAVPAARVAIVAGHASRSKLVEVEGLAPDAVREALARASAR